MQKETKQCQNCKQDFTIEPDDFGFYEKIKVPPPTFCPECRLQRRMSWRNERTLHKRKCNVPGHTEEIISMYDPELPHVVFDNKYWWGDEWDPTDYGKEYDFTKHFFKQFSELLHRIPLVALSTVNSVNSEYTNFVEGNKNCYLVFGSGYNEEVRYGNKVFYSKDSQDILVGTKCELCYECEGCTDSNRLLWSRNSKNCIDSCLLYNCKNCINCFGCANLINKSYCIWNEQYTKEEYFEKLKTLDIGSYSNLQDLKKKFIEEIYLKAVHRYANVFLSVNCTGDNISNSKNSSDCFDLYQNVENSKHQYSSLDLKDSYDGNGIFKCELLYESVDCNYDSNSFSTITVYNSSNVQYCFNCHNCKYCFGCTGLRNKQYCILNKQYTKEEYTELLPKIISHLNEMPYTDSAGKVYKYGEFFPVELSPFFYNETIAQEYFPLELEIENNKPGFNLKKKEDRNYKVDFKAEQLPDKIRDTDDSLVGKIIECEHFSKNQHDTLCNFACTEAFKILSEDFQFYKRLNIPLPRICPNCRHYQRLKQRNPLKLWHRKCMKDGCENEFETAYSPNRPEIIYCEKCYQQEVY